MSINPNNVRKKLAKNILADGFEPIIDLNKSYGSYLVDQRNGDEYLDMFSMYASGAEPQLHRCKKTKKKERARINCSFPAEN